MRSPYALLALALASPATLHGQQLLSGDLSFVPGETFNFGTIPWSEPGPGGAALTWDFSTISPTPGTPYVWEDPLPFMITDFPGVTVARDVAFSCTEYWQATPDRFSELGNQCGISLTSNTYTDPRDVIHYPFGLGNTFTDTFGGMYRLGGGAPDSSVIAGTITVTADASGTLVLPWTTHTGVLRLHLQQELELVDFGTTTNFDRYWYVVPGVHMPLLSLTRSWNSLNPTPVNSASVQLPAPTAVSDGPSSLPVTVHYRQGALHVLAPDGRAAEVALYATDGRCLGQWSLPTGSSDQVIPWTAPTTGLVIVHIRDRAGRTQVQRVVVGP